MDKIFSLIVTYLKKDGVFIFSWKHPLDGCADLKGGQLIFLYNTIVNYYSSRNGRVDMERIALISDIHANISALKAVLLDIKKRGISRIMCLGDLAGKGASPQAAVDIIKNNCEIVLKGNWDYLISEVNDSDVLEWSRIRLKQSQLEYLRELPLYFEFYKKF